MSGKWIFFILLLLPNLLLSNQWYKTYALDPFLGPEIYYMKRTKEGGAHQSGTLYGVSLGYDYICRYKFYWGIDGLWAKGTLKGKVQNEKLLSHFTDLNWEARLGYTFQHKSWRCLSFTPFVGLGYFWEYNDYHHPSPLKIRFKNTFSYVPLGFISQVFISTNWSIGIHFKLRVIIDGCQKVSHDPKFGNLTQNYEEKLQYRVELPLCYYFCYQSHSLAAGLVPFFEYRHYGHRANFPFDFLDVKLKLYGATLKLFYLF